VRERNISKRTTLIRVTNTFLSTLSGIVTEIFSGREVAPQGVWRTSYVWSWNINSWL